MFKVSATSVDASVTKRADACESWSWA